MVLISVCVMLYAPGCGLACMYSLVICIRAGEQCMYGVDKCMCHAMHTGVA